MRCRSWGNKGTGMRRSATELLEVPRCLRSRLSEGAMITAAMIRATINNEIQVVKL